MAKMPDFMFGKCHQAFGPNLCQDLVYYTDATYGYYCYAFPGTAKTTADWWVVRVKKAPSSGDRQVSHALTAGGQPGWQNVATDLTTVQGLTYT